MASAHQGSRGFANRTTTPDRASRPRRWSSWKPCQVHRPTRQVVTHRRSEISGTSGSGECLGACAVEAHYGWRRLGRAVAGRRDTGRGRRCIRAADGPGGPRSARTGPRRLARAPGTAVEGQRSSPHAASIEGMQTLHVEGQTHEGLFGLDLPQAPEAESSKAQHLLDPADRGLRHPFAPGVPSPALVGGPLLGHAGLGGILVRIGVLGCLALTGQRDIAIDVPLLQRLQVRFVANRPRPPGPAPVSRRMSAPPRRPSGPSWAWSLALSVTAAATTSWLSPSTAICAL